MVLVDLRNQGKSAELDGFLPTYNLENAAKDLANLVTSQGWDWPNVVVGHSMGGKVALQFAQSCANGDYGDIDGLPKQMCETVAEQLWVLNSVPGQVSRENSYDEVEKVWRTLQSLRSTVPSRKVDETEGKVSVHVLPNAGHWVRVDNAKGLLEIVAPKVASSV